MVGIARRERFGGGMENEKGVLGVRNLTVIDFSLLGFNYCDAKMNDLY